MNELTSNERKILTMMYKAYKQALKAGKPLDKASLFGGVKDLRSTLNLEMSEKDLRTICFSLKKKGWIDGRYQDDTIAGICLSNQSIAEFENRPRKWLKKALSFLMEKL